MTGRLFTAGPARELIVSLVVRDRGPGLEVDRFEAESRGLPAVAGGRADAVGGGPPARWCAPGAAGAAMGSGMLSASKPAVRGMLRFLAECPGCVRPWCSGRARRQFLDWEVRPWATCE